MTGTPAVPDWVIAALETRMEVAQNAYLSVFTACEAMGISREQYIIQYLANLPPITYTTW